MRSALIGFGTALPEGTLDQGRAAEALSRLEGPSEDHKRSRARGRVFQRSGVHRRHSVLLGTEGGGLDRFYGAGDGGGPSTGQRMLRFAREAPALAAAAAGRALAAADTPPASLDHLITVSCTGTVSPGLEVELIERLGLDPEVSRTHVGFMGCHGALNALRLADAFSGARPGARSLVTCVELCSLHLQPEGEQGAEAANALFADGAAALAVGPVGEAPPSTWAVAASGSTVIHEGRDFMRWTIGDRGFAMHLSPRIPEAIQAHLRPWLESWLARAGCRLSEIGSWAVHPGGPRVLDSVERALDLPPDATATSRAVLAERGNMSSATVIHILAELAGRAAPRPCVALAFGPGLAVEAALLV